MSGKIGVRGEIAWQHMSSYLALKIGYINMYKTHTHIHRAELKTLYFNFDSPLRKRFLRSISRKRLTIEISALDEQFKLLQLHFSTAIEQGITIV